MKLPVIYFDKDKYIQYCISTFGNESYLMPELETGIVDAYLFDHTTGSIVLYSKGYKLYTSYSAIGIYLELR